jgi:hypothetical protein
MGFITDFIGDITGANQAADAGRDASATQAASAQAAINEQKRQFDLLQQLQQPFVQAGTGALSSYGNLLGTNGAAAQQAAIGQIQSSPAFLSALKQGENSILQNAAATGGLRGGNTQAALAQFSPQLLTQLINNQLGGYGTLSSLGQNAAAGVGNAGMNSANNISGLLQQQGAANAGGILAQGNARRQAFGDMARIVGMVAGGF